MAPSLGGRVPAAALRGARPHVRPRCLWARKRARLTPRSRSLRSPLRTQLAVRERAKPAPSSRDGGRF